MTKIKIDGACLCGHITYEADIDPDRIAICHCTDCQINSGTAFRYGVLVPAADFRLLSGKLKVFIKTAESGSQRALSFCPECGTSIHGSAPVDPDAFSLRLGTARQRNELRPSIQIWCRSALDWVDDIGDLRQLQEQGRPPA